MFYVTYYPSVIKQYPPNKISEENPTFIFLNFRILFKVFNLFLENTEDLIHA